MREWLETQFQAEMVRHGELRFTYAPLEAQLSALWRAEHYRRAQELLDNNDGNLDDLKLWAQAWCRFGERPTCSRKHRSFVDVAQHVLSRLGYTEGAHEVNDVV